MTDRDDALDYIYKGWREGRQQRRDIRQQRGYDRTRRMLAPIMAQRARGAQSAVATPPSFADDVTTPDDESTPSIDEGAPMQQEMVSTPPAPITDERRMLPMQSEVERPISDERRMLPPPQPTSPSQEEITALAGSGRMDELRTVLDDKPKTPSQEQRKKPKQDDKGMGEFFNPKMPSEEDLISEETHKPAFEEAFNNLRVIGSDRDISTEPPETRNFDISQRIEEMPGPYRKPRYNIATNFTQVSPDEKIQRLYDKADRIIQQDEQATKNSDKEIPVASEEGKKQVMSRADELNEAVARSLGNKKPTPKEKKAESKPKAKEVDPPKEEVKVPRLGGDPDGEDVLKVIEMVRDGNSKAQSELYNALGDLEDTNSPHFEDAKEAIEEYNSNMREELQQSSEKSKKKVDEKPKKKAEMKTQDLKTTIKRKPTKDEFTRALVKALPMKDLNLLQSALDVSAGWQRDNFSPVLVDELGRITNIMNVNNDHTAMMRIAEDPNTTFPMKPTLMFPTQKVGKINPNAVPNYQDLLNREIAVTTKTGTKDLPTIYRDTMKRIKSPTKANLERALLSDEFSILDDLEGKTRPLTDADRREIIASRPRQKKQQKLPELEYGSPFYVPSTGTWEMPILEGGRSFDGITPNQILGMRSIGGRDYTNANANTFVPTPPQFKGMKEIASINPSEFMKLIRNVQKDKRKVKEIKAPRSGKVQSRRVRIGESMYDLAHLKRIASGMDDDISTEKLVFTQLPAKGNKLYDEKAGGPINIRGRGFEQYQAEPSYFDFFASPLFDDDEADSWTSMNDLFE